MKPIQVDVAIIGAGTAAMSGYGTTCARVGCMPSKLLIAAAHAAHEARHAAPFRVQVQGVTVDGPAVMERMRRERDRFVGFVLETVEAIAPADRLLVMVRFQDANTL